MDGRLRIVGLCFVLAFAGACTRAHTVAKIKNAAQVSVAFQQLGSAPIEPMPAGPRDVRLGLAIVDVEQAGYLSRERGVLRITCTKCEGKDFTLLAEDGMAARVEQSVDEILSTARGGQRFELPMEYEVSASQTLTPVLRTPTTNVEYFQQTTEPVKELGWLLIPGGLLTIVGLVVIPQDAVPGMLMFTPGLALSVFGGLHLVLPEETQRLGVDGKPLPPAPPSATEPATAGASEGQAPSDGDTPDPAANEGDGSAEAAGGDDDL